MTRREAREPELGERHGRESVPSLRFGHTVQYIARLIAAQAGVPGNTDRAVDPFLVANTYGAAYNAGAQR